MTLRISEQTPSYQPDSSFAQALKIGCYALTGVSALVTTATSISRLWNNYSYFQTLNLVPGVLLDDQLTYGLLMTTGYFLSGQVVKYTTYKLTGRVIESEREYLLTQSLIKKLARLSIVIGSFQLSVGLELNKRPAVLAGRAAIIEDQYDIRIDQRGYVDGAGLTTGGLQLLMSSGINWFTRLLLPMSPDSSYGKCLKADHLKAHLDQMVEDGSLVFSSAVRRKRKEKRQESPPPPDSEGKSEEPHPWKEETEKQKVIIDLAVYTGVYNKYSSKPEGARERAIKEDLETLYDTEFDWKTLENLEKKRKKLR